MSKFPKAEIVYHGVVLQDREGNPTEPLKAQRVHGILGALATAKAAQRLLRIAYERRFEGNGQPLSPGMIRGNLADETSPAHVAKQAWRMIKAMARGAEYWAMWDPRPEHRGELLSLAKVGEYQDRAYIHDVLSVDEGRGYGSGVLLPALLARRRQFFEVSLDSFDGDSPAKSWFEQLGLRSDTRDNRDNSSLTIGNAALPQQLYTGEIYTALEHLQVGRREDLEAFELHGISYEPRFLEQNIPVGVASHE